MKRPVFELNCLLCGTEVGEVRDGRFIHHPGCNRTLRLRGGALRCCRCGGSLYSERAGGLTFNSPALLAASERMAQLAAS